MVAPPPTRLVVGLLAIPPDLPFDLARDLAEELPELLGGAVSDEVTWTVRTAGSDRHLRAEGRIEQMVDIVHERMTDEGWDVAVCLTDAAVRDDRSRPLIAFAAAERGVALVSVPALGALRQRRHTRKVVVGLVEELVAERLGMDRENRAVGRLLVRTVHPARHVTRGVAGLSLLAGRTNGGVRLLIGMVRANSPARLVVRLTRLLVVALVTAAASMIQSTVWQLGPALGWVKLTLLTFVSVGAVVATLIIGHDLWEHVDPQNDRVDRDRARLYNAATLTTLTLGVAINYLALLVLTLATGLLLLEASVLAAAIGRPVGLVDYVTLSWLTSSIASLGGALGSATEDTVDVQAAAYGRDPDSIGSPPRSG